MYSTFTSRTRSTAGFIQGGRGYRHDDTKYKVYFHLYKYTAGGWEDAGLCCSTCRGPGRPRVGAERVGVGRNSLHVLNDMSEGRREKGKHSLHKPTRSLTCARTQTHQTRTHRSVLNCLTLIREQTQGIFLGQSCCSEEPRCGK